MSSVAGLLKRLSRTFAIVVMVVAGSTILVRFAPGYLSDAREMDSRYGDATRVELSAEAARSASLQQMLSTEFSGWTHGDLGVSRQYDVPVAELILPRLAVTGGVLLRAIAFAWTLALIGALVSSAGRNPSLLWQTPSTLLLAVPTAAMATVCMLSDRGGPVLVMTLLVAARDFKFLDRLLRKTWREPHLLQARAQGLTTLRLVCAHILPGIASQLLALATLSIVTALSALVPVEVIFSVPGLGQLAWNAAMNRDLPVLLAVTMIMAVAVTFAGMPSDSAGEWQGA
ncbi:MAG: ABC transporter permease [Terracidiphilus sp.]|jgi:peptide/nickel transport system permease protein